MTKLQTLKPAALSLPGVSLSPTGLVVSRELSEQEWQQAGAALQMVEGAVAWWLGDWANYAEGRWSEKYQRLVELTGYAFNTIHNVATVCRTIENTRRRAALSFGHHEAVCALSRREQDEWLDVAERERLTLRELRASIDAGRLVRSSELDQSNARQGFDSVESLLLPFQRIYKSAWRNESLDNCEDAGRLQAWIAATEPMAEANAKAKKRLATIRSNRADML